MQKQKKASKKVKREIANVLNREQRVRRKLLMMNPYAQTLLDPFNVHGVRIPDDALYPSVPFTIVDRRTLTANAAGIAGCCYGFWSTASHVSAGSLIPIPTSGIPGSVTDSFVGMEFGTDATLANLTEGAVPGTGTGVKPIQFTQWFVSNPTVPTYFDKVRLVSAGLNIQCTANFSNNQGKYTAAFAPRNYSRAIGGVAIPLTYIQQMPDSITVPISLEKGITVTYSPVDEYSYRYAQIGNAGGIGDRFEPDITSAADWEINAQYSPGELWCAMDGAAANATFLVTAVFNYEGIVSTNSLLLSSAETSKADPIAMTHALRVRDAVPTAQATSANANGMAFGQSSPSDFKAVTSGDKSPRMFDSILNVLSSAPQTIDKVTSAMDSLTPYAEQGLELIEGFGALL